MCGIAGLLRPGGLVPGDLEAVAAMTQVQAHRGPDGDGAWHDAAAGVAFGHRRLSIIDLNPTGDQPMASADGRFVVTYNGELYNHRELRAELATEGYRFRGTSDTETLVAACARWGVERTLQRSDGMYAFAAWDATERELWLARDRCGEKPLYYGRADGAWLFASEVNAIACHPGFERRIDDGALALYMRHGYVPHPHSIYDGVFKLPPGAVLRLGTDTVPRRWFSGVDLARQASSHPFRGSEDEATHELERRLVASVGSRMLSDVGLGAFLSGGVDSSLVVACMRRHADVVRTFTIGFDEQGYDEAPYARQVAAHLGTDHQELYVKPSDAWELVERIPRRWGEPFADSSQLPTMLVSALARRHVTVALSGDGGDELFGGYQRYRVTADYWRRLQRAPQPLRRMAAALAGSVPPVVLDGVLRRLATRMRGSNRPVDLRHRRDAIELYGAARTLTELYRPVVSSWVRPPVPGAAEPPTLLSHPPDGLEEFGDIEQLMLLDLLTYLPDDLLTKVDRASMGVSLEVRAPLLDPEVMSFAWSLPAELRYGRRPKHLLKRVLERHVPTELVDRPKLGFGVPVGAWLRGPLRDWASDLLSDLYPSLDTDAVARVWGEHQAGTADHGYRLWPVLVFQDWLRRGP